MRALIVLALFALLALAKGSDDDILSYRNAEDENREDDFLTGTLIDVEEHEEEDVFADASAAEGATENVDYEYQIASAQELEESVAESNIASGESLEGDSPFFPSEEQAKQTDLSTAESTTFGIGANLEQVEAEAKEYEREMFLEEGVPAVKSCKNGHVLRDGLCRGQSACDPGFYRRDGKCARLPSARTCKVEIDAIVKRNKEEEPARKRELSLIETAVVILRLYENFDDKVADDHKTKKLVHQMVKLMDTASEEEQDRAIAAGKPGILQLFKEIEANLKKEADISKREESSLKRHCRQICSVGPNASKAAVTNWEQKKEKLAVTLTHIRSKVATLTGEADSLRDSAQAAYANNIKLGLFRRREIALIGWIRNKLQDLREGEDLLETSFSGDELAPVLAGIDESDSEMAGLTPLLRHRSVDAKKILNQLEHIEAAIKNADAEDTYRAKELQKKLHEKEALIARLKSKEAVYEGVLSKISVKLSLSEHQHRHQIDSCANLGILY